VLTNMKLTHSFSGHLLLSLFVATPTVVLSTLAGVMAQPIRQPILSKPSLEVNTINRQVPGVAKVIQRAKSDPAFYQALVANPEKALANVNYLDANTKAALGRLITQEASFGTIDEVASGCVCTGCCVTSIGKPGTLERLDPLRGGLRPNVQQPILKPQNELR
jgi:hypothetical protein